jgi:hypothetical protein
MPKFLTTHGVAFNIEDIIIKTKCQLTLVSPYLQLSDIFFDRLKDANARGVEITIIYGKDQLNPAQKSQIFSLNKVSLHFCPNLHAKCYFNEEMMVITSMNMYEFSEKNNREMGILLSVQDDLGVFNEAKQEADAFRNHSTRQNYVSTAPVMAKQTFEPPRSRTPVSPAKEHTKEKEIDEGLIGGLKGFFNSVISDKGFCIRCRKTIDHDAKHPFCEECYSSWAKFKNAKYAEDYCHTCGTTTKTTKAAPDCPECYKNR